MNRSRLAFLIPLFVLSLGLSFAPSASACGSFRCWLIFSDGSSLHGTCTILVQTAEKNPGSTVMYMGETTVTSLGGSHALVTVTGYAATSMSDACADGLSAVNGLQSVNSAIVLNTETGQPLRESRYRRNNLAGEGFAAAANESNLGPQGQPWQGFSSRVLRPVADETPLTYVFDVTLKPGFRIEQFAKNLSSEGFLGTARANGDGSLNPDHIHIRTLGLTPVNVVVLPLQVRPATQ